MVSRAIFLSLLTLVVSSISMAQLDPSSAILLNSGRANTRDSALDSGRYTIRQRSDSPPSPNSHRDDPRPPAASTKKSQVETKDEMPPAPVTVTLPAPAEPAVHPQPNPVAAATPQPEATPRPRKSLVESRKQNLVELDLAPGFLYINSDSSYYFRRFSASSPSVNVDTKVWMSPTFALHFGYLTSLSAHVSDALDGSKNVAASQSWMNAGLRFRRYIQDVSGNDGLNFTLGLDYYEFNFGVSSDAVLRQKIKSTGVKVSLDSEIPSGMHYAWTLGFWIAPKLDHREIKGAADFKSGRKADSNAVGASLGGRIQFEKQDAIFWKVSHSIEKNLFSGDASPSDPVTTLTPASVGVTNSTTLLEIGYSWGN